MEFMGVVAAYGTGTGNNGAKVQVQAGKNARVGFMHQVVGLLQGILGKMKRAGIFQQEFPGSHYPETRTDFIAELGLDLVEVQGQLLVTIDLVTCQIRDDLLMGRAKTESAIVAILDPQ